MKRKALRSLVILVMVAALTALAGAGGATAQLPVSPAPAGLRAPIGTAFTYQGELTDGGTPANGYYEFRFELYDAEIGGTQVGDTLTPDEVLVTDGQFSVLLDFGSGIFTGDARWLEVGVRPLDSPDPFTTLEPRQQLTAAPYALYASSIPDHDHPLPSHDHLNETWTGSGDPLMVNGAFGAPGHAPLVLENSDPLGNGLRVLSAGANGVLVDGAGANGVVVETATDAGMRVLNSGTSGLWVSSAGEYGLRVDWAGLNGVYIDSSGGDGMAIGSAADFGVRVGPTGGHGVSIQAAGQDGINVSAATSNGLRVDTATLDGLHVGAVGGDGVMVETATGNGMRVLDASGSGLWVDSAGEYGLRLDSAGSSGIYVGSTGSDGITIASAGDFGMRVGPVGGHGVYVESAAQDGMYVGSATYNGLRVDAATLDGLHVGAVGGDGVMVETAIGNGMRVLDASGSGLWVDSAGEYGLRLDSAGSSGIYVGSTGSDGITIASAGDFGMRVGPVGGHGVYVESAAQDGMYVGSATYNGLRVDSAVLDGVHIGSAGGYAGYFGGDINVTGTCYGCEVATFGVNASGQTLSVGDIVSIQGIVASEFEGLPVLMQVGPAGSGEPVIGVVLGGAESESGEERGLDEDRSPDADGQRLVPSEGPAPAGGYVSILLFGPAQVRASVSGDPITAGTRLVAGDGGGARALRTVEVEGIQVAESAPVLGIALEDVSAEGLIWVLVNPQ